MKKEGLKIRRFVGGSRAQSFLVTCLRAGEDGSSLRGAVARNEIVIFQRAVTEHTEVDCVLETGVSAVGAYRQMHEEDEAE